MRKPNLFHIATALFFLNLLFSDVSGQSLPTPLTSSPNAATLEKFTEVPVNLFTGTPDISIPIHVLKYGNISVPITLRYNPAAVKPAINPGWVGFGWDLQSYGAITRLKRGFADDLYGDPGNSITEPANSANSYYPVPGNSSNFAKSGSEIVNDPNWATTSYLVNNFQVNANNTSGVNDVQADEFSFNFMGYSGTFYYEGPTLGWQVVSKDNITVTLNGFLKPTDIYSAISQFQPFKQSICNNCSVLDMSYQPNAFAGFTLTVPDGTQYVFGGVNATEFESVLWYGPGYFQFLANTWLLTKIIDANHNEVDFTYQRTFPTISVAFSGFSDSHITASTTTGCSVSNATQVASDTTKRGGHYEWPMYLSKISSPNESVIFNITPATCLRFPNFMLLSNDGSNVNPSAGPIVPTPSGSDLLVPSPVNGTLNNIQWEELSSIVINTSANTIYRQYNFSYNNLTSQRLTLTGLSENDSQNNSIGTYGFQYNNVSTMSALTNGGSGALYYDGNGTDHWGFFNGQNLNGVNGSGIMTARQTNTSYVTTGLLNKVIYPTGGYTTLAWEAHDYSSYVSTNRQSLVSATGYAGGSRIKEIKSFDMNGAVLLDKNYIYKTGYSSSASVSSLNSSGVLNGFPQYTFTDQNRQTVSGNTKVSVYLEAFDPLTTYSYAGSGSYIGYNEVAEVNADGSYTKHYFTNYGADLNGVSHFDQPPAGAIGWILGGNMDAYLPMNSLDVERGKPVGTFDYTSGDILIHKISYSYRNDAARFNNYLHLIDVSPVFAQCNPADLFVYESAREKFTYDYYPISKVETTYDQSGGNPVTLAETYNSYDANNMLTQKTVVNSRGESVITNYTYPAEASDATSQAMVAAHILSPLLSTSVSNNGATVSIAKTAYSSPYSNYYLPSSLSLQTGSNSPETRSQIYQYDTHGNIQEESKTGQAHTVYLWGYNSQYLVARITNSTFTQVQAAMTANNITQAQLDNPATSDATMQGLLNTLRSALPGSQVTTYTYIPVSGISSETDPKGKTTVYQYDAFNRLMNIVDYNGNIVKHFDYHYQGH